MEIIRDDEMHGLMMIPLLQQWGITRCNVSKCCEKPTTIITGATENPIGLCEKHYNKTREIMKNLEEIQIIKIKIQTGERLKASEAAVIVDILENYSGDFKTAVRPLMKYLAENHHPHTNVIVESNRAEMVEGVKCCNTDEYLVD